jgi:hypothetical protein
MRAESRISALPAARAELLLTWTVNRVPTPCNDFIRYHPEPTSFQ